jgi:putative ABC transport system permease protein
MKGVAQDLRFALRQFLLRPGFSALVAITLAVGIGANVAIFSIVKGLILRSLPYPEADRVVAIWETGTGQRSYQPFTPPDYFDMREQTRTLKEMGVYRFNWVNLAGDPEPTRAYAARGTASTLRALGVGPTRGRLFTDDEEIEGNHHVVILSDRLWKRRFGGVPDIVGQRMTIDGASYAIIGVMPEDYEFPRPWSMMTEDPELWMPLPLARDGSMRGWHFLAAVGRLEDGVTVEQAEAELKGMAAELAEMYPDTNAQVDVWIDPLAERSLGYVRSFLLILTAVVGLVLLIACANVASMLLARGTARMSELAIRASMGAGRGRLVRQLMTESMLLSALGGAIGVLLAVWGVEAIKARIPPYIPRVEGIRLDGDVLLYSILIMALTGFVFGLLPALLASRTDLIGELKEGRGSQAGGRKHNRIFGALVVGQLATAFVLANGAGLLIVSYLNVFDIPRGFDTEQVLVAGISTDGPGYEETEQRVAFWDELIGRVEALPSVEYAAATNKLPMSGGNNGRVLVEGETYDPDVRRPLVEYSYVSPHYFDAMGISLLSGRLLDERDRVTRDVAQRGFTPGVAPEGGSIVVNQAFADRYWPEGDALGRRIRENAEPATWSARVVGVVENVPQWGVEYPALPEIYFHYSLQVWTFTRLVVRAAGDPLALTPALRQALHEMDSQVPLAGVRTMGDELHEATERRRFSTLMVSLFAVTALILVVAGTYGVMSYYVSRRTHEIGVRVALGADSHKVLRLFLSQGLRLVALGLVIGLGGSLAAGLMTSRMVFGVSPYSPWFLGQGAIVMLVVALAAISVPVFRATRVDPNDALRIE